MWTPTKVAEQNAGVRVLYHRDPIGPAFDLHAANLSPILRKVLLGQVKLRGNA
jgi:hypothetical protein